MRDRLALSVEEAADELGVSSWTVYRLVESGHLRKIPHLGRRVQIARIELERFVASGIEAA